MRPCSEAEGQEEEVLVWLEVVLLSTERELEGEAKRCGSKRKHSKAFYAMIAKLISQRHGKEEYDRGHGCVSHGAHITEFTLKQPR